jgi:Nuclease-related domain
MESTVFPIVLGVVLVAVLLQRGLSPAMKGSRGERMVHTILRKSLPASGYTVLRDVTLRTDGGTTQIDHVVISRFGVFVIETRHLAGWIFGAEHDSHWTQSFADSRVEFQNPLLQNRAHIRALQVLLGLPASRFHSLVVFTGKAEFKTAMPLNVMQPDRLAAFIQVNATPSLAPEAMQRAVRTIERNRLEPGAATQAPHVESLRARRGSAGDASKQPGPRSGSCPGPRQGAGARVAWKALAGVASLALLLLAGNVLVGRSSGAIGITARPAAYPAARLPPAQPDATPSEANPSDAAQLDPGQSGATPSDATPSDATPSDVTRWGRSDLHCGYSADTRRCACSDPDGRKVPMELEACQALVDNARR